jgi:micrococcal nuclease
MVALGFLTTACQEPEPTPVDNRITLADLSGKTEAEVQEYFEGIDLTVIIRYIQTGDVAAGYFIRYVSYETGDLVEPGTSIRVEIAQALPSAPTISGVDDVSIYVAVQGNPPTFDPEEGVTATDYLGNDIPFGSFLYIKEIRNSQGNPVASIDYYRVGTYTIVYEAINSSLVTTVERILTLTVPPFDTNYTDGLRLSVSYTNLSFIDDGIGEVTVTTFTDGDTTNFIDNKTGIRFTVRYLGIDAPEATSKYDPWGIKAGNFVREKLSGAEKIILQAEGERTDGNGRYLAWVWYVKDGVTRLLNLELVEQAYAWVSSASTTQYGNVFTVAGAETQLTGKRIYGEEDPDYDYSTAGTPILIGDLLDNFDDYIGRKVTVTGVITSKVGYSVYLEENGRGIFLYTGYNLTNELQIGYEVTIQGLVPAVYFESKQLTNYKYENMVLIDTDNEVTITTIVGTQMGDYVGRVVRFDHLTVIEIDEAPNSEAYTVVAQDSFGTTVNIRVDDFTASFVPSYTFEVGDQFMVFGPVTQYYSNFQLMLPGINNIEFK